jgi:drug/metabolite transporter (DMT)-like permease
MESYFYVVAALALTVYGQIAIKSRALLHAGKPGSESYGPFLFAMFGDPWVISAFAAAVIAAAAWMLAIRKEDLSILYPFMALTFVLVPILAAFVLGERITPLQICGMLMIVGGVSLATLAR